MPADLDETFSSVRQAQAQLMEAAAQVGVVATSYDLTPKQMIEQFMHRDPQGNIDRIYEKIIREAPAVKQAEAKVLQTQRNLDQANLNLSYCRVFAEIDGVVSRRNVNPGNNVQAGQQVMALQSTRDLWVDANFKETQLASLRIGQHVDIYADMYGERKMFKGHVTGFTMGTGSTLALLPPENATGNFVKSCSGCPCGSNWTNTPHNDPLFIGLSVDALRVRQGEADGSMPAKYLQPYLDGAARVAIAADRARPTARPDPESEASETMASLQLPVARRAINPWLVAAVVVIPTFMEILDTTVANVSLRDIAGGLSAAVIDSRVGDHELLGGQCDRRAALRLAGGSPRPPQLLSALDRRVHDSSGLCGMATSLWQIIVFRALQGVGGGGLQPSSQGILLDSFPAEKQGAAMTLFGVAALLAPVVGPTLGGWITVQYEWRWIFYINVPVGLLAL